MGVGPPSWLSPKLNQPETCAWFWPIQRYTWLGDGTGGWFSHPGSHTFESLKPQLPTPIESPPILKSIYLTVVAWIDKTAGSVSRISGRMNGIWFWWSAPRWHLISRIFASSCPTGLTSNISYLFIQTPNITKLKLTWPGFWTIICGAIRIPFFEWLWNISMNLA